MLKLTVINTVWFLINLLTKFSMIKGFPFCQQLPVYNQKIKVFLFVHVLDKKQNSTMFFMMEKSPIICYLLILFGLDLQLQ